MGAFNVIMRIVSTIIGLLMVAGGGIWFLQGINMAPPPLNHGFMMGDWHWALHGGILVVVGICQAIWSNTRQKG